MLDTMLKVLTSVTTAPTTNYDTCYLGACWENFQQTDGTVRFTKLYAYRMNREIRYAKTEEEARRISGDFQ